VAALAIAHRRRRRDRVRAVAALGRVEVCRDEAAYGEELKKCIFPAVIEDVDWRACRRASRRATACSSRARRSARRRSISSSQRSSPISTGSASTRGCSSVPPPGNGKDAARHELLSGRACRRPSNGCNAAGRGRSATALHLEYLKAGRDGATRRRNYLMTSLAAGFVLAVALAGVALWQRGVAVEQQAIAVVERDKATQSFRCQADRRTRRVRHRPGAAQRAGLSADAVRKILETARRIRSARGFGARRSRSATQAAR